MTDKPETDNPTIETQADLKDQVKELIDNPLSVWAVAATVESMGIREVDARKEFGYDSIFDLSSQLYEDLKQEAYQEKPIASGRFEKKLNTIGFWEQAKQFVTYYLQGLLFSLPLLSQIAALFIFRYSLWAWLEFNEAQATIVAFGTITSFVVTGGFLQVLGHSITSYISSDNYFLAYQSTRKIIKAGIGSVLGVAFLIIMLNISIPFYPRPMVLLGTVYMILISLLLLASGVLYALKRRISIVVIVVIGTLLLVVNMELLQLGIYLSQWLAMLFTTGLLAGYASLFFRLQIRKKQRNIAAQTLPDTEVRHFINYRYFMYGIFYFLFVFLDRLLAWSTSVPPPPFILWFNTPYEIGMDWALMTLVLSFAMLEYSVNIFSRRLKPLQEKFRFQQLERFNKYFKRLYIKQLVLLIVTGLVSTVITYYSVSSLMVYQETIPEVRDFFANAMTAKVFWIASISYVFLTIGLLHCLFFFSLSKPNFAMYSILAGLVVNFMVGYLCSRIFALEYATIGLLAGSVVFAIISGIMAHNFFKRLDYYYYSAF